MTRIVGNVAFSTDSATAVAVLWVLFLRRDGSNDLPLATSNWSIDGRDSEVILAHGTFVGDATGQNAIMKFDVKGQRKVYKDDVLRLGVIGSTTNGTFSIAFKTFIKES